MRGYETIRNSLVLKRLRPHIRILSIFGGTFTKMMKNDVANFIFSQFVKTKKILGSIEKWQSTYRMIGK